MNPVLSIPRFSRWHTSKRSQQRGFTLVELTVTVGLFLVIGGAAFALLNQDMPLYNSQQNLTKLNLGLRNAATQLELDLANAGAGVNQGGLVVGFPVGVTIVNRAPATGLTCNTPATLTYGVNCFDDLNIVIATSGTPVLQPDYLCTAEMNTSTGTMLAKPFPGDTAATDKSYFLTGDQILMVTGNGKFMTTFVLTSNATVSGTDVLLTYTATNADGTNSSSTNDPLGITTNGNVAAKLMGNYCVGDSIIHLSPINYTVDSATDTTNPRLMRTQSGASDVVAEQIVAFKVGATIWNAATSTDVANYNYDASSYGNPAGNSKFDFTLVRSVGVTLIGRTPPNKDANYTYRNNFDGGPYIIQGVSIAINPRNLTMND
jgi:prepilin-type N-terminal cleavage/methylation domain-containing protein